MQVQEQSVTARGSDSSFDIHEYSIKFKSTLTGSARHCIENEHKPKHETQLQLQLSVTLKQKDDLCEGSAGFGRHATHGEAIAT